MPEDSIPKKRPFLVTFEGIDGCGKTTILSHVTDYCQSKSIPYKTIAEKHHPLIQSKIFNSDKLPSFQLQLLYWWQTRRELLEENYLFNEFEDLNVVFFDRYYDSTYAYQYLTTGSIESKFNFNSSIFPTPNLTFYLQLDQATALDRLVDRNSNDFYEKLDSLKYIDQYNNLYTSQKCDREYNYNHTIEIIDVSLSENTVAEIVISKFKRQYFNYAMHV